LHFEVFGRVEFVVTIYPVPVLRTDILLQCIRYRVRLLHAVISIADDWLEVGPLEWHHDKPVQETVLLEGGLLEVRFLDGI
jgi:hypothetical protein